MITRSKSAAAQKQALVQSGSPSIQDGVQDGAQLMENFKMKVQSESPSIQYGVQDGFQYGVQDGAQDDLKWIDDLSDDEMRQLILQYFAEELQNDPVF